MPEQFLSQDEVDALLADVNGDTSAPEEDAQPADGVRTYDLANQERIVRGRMPTLEIINERFARNLRVAIFNFMRKSPEISVGSVKVQKYSAFLRDVVVPTNINVISLAPLRGNGLMIIEPRLVFGVIDNLFGGSGKFHTRIEGRDFTLTEQRIILRLVEVILGEYKRAWAGVYPFDFIYQRSEMHTQFANVATPSEIVVSTSLELELGEGVTGKVFLCVPYSSIEPIRDILFSTLQGDQAEPDKRWISLLKEQVQLAEVELVAELGDAAATVGDLLKLAVGDFIELDLKPTLTCKVDNVPLLKARYGVSKGSYALKVENLISYQTENAKQGAAHV